MRVARDHQAFVLLRITDLSAIAMTQRIELPPLWTAQEQALDIR